MDRRCAPDMSPSTFTAWSRYRVPCCDQARCSQRSELGTVKPAPGHAVGTSACATAIEMDPNDSTPWQASSRRNERARRLLVGFEAPLGDGEGQPAENQHHGERKAERVSIMRTACVSSTTWASPNKSAPGPGG